MRYYYKKNFYSPKDVECAQIIFENKDCISLNKAEIIDFDFKFYDNMIIYNETIIPVVKSGFLKLKLSRYKSSRNDCPYMNNIKEYNKDRRKYIENLLCNNYGKITVRFFDTNSFHKSLNGNFKAIIEDEYLVLKAVDSYPLALSDNDCFSIELHNIAKSIIRKINLVFENCESFEIYKEEILDMQLNLNDQLYEYSDNYIRQLTNGYIVVKFDPSIFYRKIYLLSELKTYKTKHLKQRLCHNKDKITHNICLLDIHYDYAGYGLNHSETIDTNGIWANDDLFIGGYCEKLDDNVICIHFKKLKVYEY